jgi:hypothetical protein
MEILVPAGRESTLSSISHVGAPGYRAATGRRLHGLARCDASPEPAKIARAATDRLPPGPVHGAGASVP